LESSSSRGLPKELIIFTSLEYGECFVTIPPLVGVWYDAASISESLLNRSAIAPDYVMTATMQGPGNLISTYAKLAR
jgi:hypothetical protein